MGVVQLRAGVGEAGAEVQKHRGGLAGEAKVAVRRARRHALVQAQHGADAGHRVDASNKVHLSSSGVTKNKLDSARFQRAKQ